MKRSKFSLSNYKLASLNQGQLVPIGMTEVLPGDTFQHATNCFIRVSPLVTPVMHPVHAKIMHFFVPHRLVWNRSEDGDANGWESFITGGADGFDESIFPTVKIDQTTGGVGSLADYLGCPIPGLTYDEHGTPVYGTGELEVSALPFRAYALIFNEYFRDQDLVDPLSISTDEGDDTETNLVLQNAAWEKDYFTSARPWEQKGPAISLPLSGDADVLRKPGAQPAWRAFTGGTTDPLSTGSPAWNNVGGETFLDATGTDYASWDPKDTLFADLSDVTAIDMNDLRIAMALQRYEEARARYGSRYVEYLRYLGVKSSDARLQRPELLGSGRQTIQFSEVLQTAEGTDPVGEMRGHGIGVLRSNRYRRFFEEHGYVISLLVVRPVPMYAQGLNRTWNRRTKEDFWQKELQHVGQQAILNKELYAAAAQPDATLGYQDRYDEYRRSPSSIAGEMRTLLSSWHMARIFDDTPVLNGSFVTSNPTDRIYASSATNQLYAMVRHSIQARRLIAQSGSSFIY